MRYEKKWLVIGFALMFLVPGAAIAVEEADFVLDTTGDLLDLCMAPETDPLHQAAVHFCIGFLVGAYHYHEAENAGSAGNLLVCLPDPPPPRVKVVSRFVDWAKQHPRYMNEEPVDTWFRFLIETYPCRP